MKSPLILLTNDDGYHAKGLSSLLNSIKDIGEIMLIAPDRPQSGMGHAITVNNPVKCNKINFFSGINAFNCSGTPVDCVKMGIYLLNGRKPDMILSGINHGSNVSTNILYSGTMAAAVEGALDGIPSIGFSLTDFSVDADFSYAEKIVQLLTKKVLLEGLKKGTCLNVNIPNVNESQIKGIKVCKQGKAYWEDTFEKRKDPLGKDYYWLTGSFTSQDKDEETDVNFLKNNYVTVVPSQYDMTCLESVNKLKKWKL